MIKLKIALLSICLSFITSTISAQSYKIKDSSSKRAPEWFGGMQPGVIITSAISEDIEDAKRQCMDDVRSRIIESVALNVKSSSESNISQTIVNNKVSSFLDDFQSTMRSQAANVPYLTSISHSRVDGYYWEMRVDKESKKSTFLYTIKYPFSDSELRSLVRAFKAQDDRMESQLKEIEDAYSLVSSVDQVKMAINELTTLKDYFFDDVRSNRVTVALKNYSDIFSNIFIKRVSDELGNERYALLFNERVLSYSKSPKVTSNTAYEIYTDKDDDEWLVKYNYSTMYPDEDNYLDITWNLNGKNLKERFYVKLQSSSKSLIPMGVVKLIANQSDSASFHVELIMTVNNNSNESYVVSEVVLQTPLFYSDIVFAPDVTVGSKGHQVVKAKTTDAYTKAASKSGVVSKITKGVITYIDKNNKKVSASFSLPFSTNW